MRSFGLSPTLASCMSRNPIRLEILDKNGMRRSVFSLFFPEGTLICDRFGYLSSKTFRSTLNQAVNGRGSTVDVKSFDTNQSGTKYTLIDSRLEFLSSNLIADFSLRSVKGCFRRRVLQFLHKPEPPHQ